MDTPTIHTPELVLGRRGFTQLEDCASLALIARVCCPQFCDLTGTTVLLQSSTGEEWEVELVAFNGVENETEEFTVRTGTSPGVYSWTATYLDATEGKPSHAETTSSVEVDYRPHAPSLAVWDIPTPVREGEKITLKVGAKCNNDCLLAGTVLSVRDEQDRPVVDVALGAEPWTGSKALYWAEAAFEAPTEMGVHTYRVYSDSQGDHGAAQTSFSFFVVQKPSYTLSITLRDKETEAPIPSAYASLHPYTAITDETGLASIPAVAGEGKLNMGADGYESRQLDIAVTGDVALTLALTAKPVYEGDF
jgi:hypothetical protein